MIIKLIGWSWLVMGLFFFAKPGFLKEKVLKKGVKKLKKALLALTLSLSGLFIWVGFKFSGIPSKIILIMGIIGVFKAFIFLKTSLAQKLMDWWQKQPVGLFRLASLFHIGIGLVILLSAKR